jgi:hypothetical protein
VWRGDRECGIGGMRNLRCFWLKEFVLDRIFWDRIFWDRIFCDRINRIFRINRINRILVRMYVFISQIL